MRCVSFQSLEVLDILLTTGTYKSNPQKCREKRDYSADVRQLNGAHPIWVFSNPNLTYKSLEDGTLFERWRCEMSLNQEKGLTRFAMLELEIAEGRLRKGLTHNAYDYASVVSELNYYDLNAVYHVEHSHHWYYKRLVLDKVINGDALLTLGGMLDTAILCKAPVDDKLQNDTAAFHDFWKNNSSITTSEFE